MKAVTIHDAKSNLSKYIAAAKKGQPVYIGSFGKAEVMLSVVPGRQDGKRIFGFAKGKMSVRPDAFSPRTDAEITKLLLDD